MHSQPDEYSDQSHGLGLSELKSHKKQKACKHITKELRSFRKTKMDPKAPALLPHCTISGGHIIYQVGPTVTHKNLYISLF